MPAFSAGMTFPGGALPLILLTGRKIVAVIEDRDGLAEHFNIVVTVNAFRAGIPGNHLPFGIEQE